MKLHSDSPGVKRPIGRLGSPRSLSQPTHHHVSSSSFFFSFFASSILLRAQNMTRLLGCVHTWFSLTAPDIWPTLIRAISDIQMKETFSSFLVEFTIFFTVLIPAVQNDFLYMLFLKPNWKRNKGGGERKIWLYNHRSTLPRRSNHLEPKLAYLGILCNISQQAVLGTCFPQISPSVTAILESDDLKALIL